MGSTDAFIAKYSSNGVLLWLRDIPSAGSGGIQLLLDSVNSVFYTLGTFQGNCLLDTITVTTPAAVGVALAKWNLDGHCLWARTIASSALVFDIYGVKGNSFVLDGSGELMICLTTSPYGRSQVEGELLSPGTYLGKYNSDGQGLWWKPFTQFSGIQKNVELHGLKYRAGRIYGYGAAGLPAGGPDTTTVDTIQIIGRQGLGFALASIDPATGIADWFRLDGFPQAGVASQAMSIDDQGDIVVVGAYGDIAIFGEDTLSAAMAPYNRGFIAKYTSAGTLQYVREFAGSNTFYFNAVDLTPEGYMALTGSFKGQIALGGSIITSNTNADLFVAIHDPAGEPRAFMHAGLGAGTSIGFLGNDLIVCGLFPGETAPFGSISIGDETYTSHGYRDIVLARTSLPTSISSVNVGEERLLIFPNPNNGLSTIVLPFSVKPGSDLVLTIHDAMGRLVQQSSLRWHEGTIPLDISTHAKGVYHADLLVGKQRYSATIILE
jgi:hypothetical protein